MRDLLTVIVDGCQQAVRLTVEGRSTAQGKLPAWLERAAAFDVVGLQEGSTVVLIEAPSLADAAPQHFGQQDLFINVDPSLSCLDLLEQSVHDAVEGLPESDAYDDGLIKTFEGFSRVLRHGVDAVVFENGARARIDGESVKGLRRLRQAIPPDQHARVAGKLDVLRHSDRMFTLTLESGAHVRGVVAGDGVSLSSLGELWGQNVVVTGVAKFRPSSLVLRIEAERIELAEERDLGLWSIEPRPILETLNQQVLRQPQGSRSGVSAVLGRLADAGTDTDDAIIDALEEFS